LLVGTGFINTYPPPALTSYLVVARKVA